MAVSACFARGGLQRSARSLVQALQCWPASSIKHMWHHSCCLPCPVSPCLQTEEFHEQWRLKARDVLARTEWRKRKLVKRVRARCWACVAGPGLAVAELLTCLRPPKLLPSLPNLPMPARPRL